MKKLRFLFCLTAVLFLCVVTTNIDAAPKNYVKSLKLSNTVAKIEEQSSAIIDAFVIISENYDSSVSVKVKNQKVATAEVVDFYDGTSVIKITGVKAGKTSMKVTTNGKNKRNKKVSKTVNITVLPATSNTPLLGQWITENFDTVYNFTDTGKGSIQQFSNTNGGLAPYSTSPFTFNYNGNRLTVIYEDYVSIVNYTVTLGEHKLTLTDDTGKELLLYSTDILDSRKTLEGHCYAVYTDSISWEEAKETCERLGGHLATITSAEENEFIGSLLSSSDVSTYWVGGFRSMPTEVGWEWVTGEPWSYTNWDDPGPRSESKLYLEMYDASNGYKWNCCDSDIKAYMQGYICEWDTQHIDEDHNKLIGDWEYEEGYFYWHFNADGTGAWSVNSPQQTSDMKIWFHDNGDSVAISFDGWNSFFEYPYNISGNTLTISDFLGDNVIYHKVY